jgi:signal transduction histidine kinase
MAPRTWISAHKERVAYALVALLLLATVAAAAPAGVLLRHSANTQRQTLRLQALEASAVRLAAGGSSRAAVTEAFRRVRSNDGAAAERLRPAYLALLAHPGMRSLEQFAARVDDEVQLRGESAHDVFPVARAMLISEACTTLLLIVVLIWLFEVQRRAGRIDRDNAEESRELARLKDEFVAVVSHELRTPLTSILGFIDLIADDTDTLSSEQQEYFDVVKRNANRLLYLVSDLLLIAEAEDGRLRLDLQEVDLKAIAHDSVEAARVAADRKRIDLTLSADDAQLDGDPLRLAQLMDNLISNAIKFTPEGGRVTVTTGSRNGHVALEVKDSGIGISDVDREQIFDRFFRARGASKSAVTGTGLGLAITKAIVDAHGGSISVDSEVGRGTSFRIRLPAGVPEAVAVM